MKHVFLASFCWLFLSAVAFAQQSGEIEPFTLPSIEAGKKVVISDKAAHELTVLCFLGTECPLAKLYAGRLQQLDEQFEAVRFVGINSNVQDSLEDIGKYLESTGIKFEFAKDNRNLIADKLNITRTPEVVVINRNREVVYRGRVDDQYLPGVSRNEARRQDLRLAIEQALAGNPVEVAVTEPEGCLLGRVREADPDATVTFSKQVSRVLQRNCIECHRSGEIGPFSMETYEETVGWADMILEVIEEKRMPPWHADKSVGTFANARTISRQDVDLLKAWVEQGTPEGSRADLPQPYQSVDGWRLPRKPDAVIEMRKRPFVVPADGTVEYQYFVVDPGFTEDRWVTAAQVIPGNRSVVHHTIVFIRPPDGLRPRGVGWLAAYVPGQTPLAYQQGRARFVPKGSKLVFQQHYTPTGTSVEDVTKIGMVFADPTDVENELMTVMAIDQSFEIQPHDESHFVGVQTRRLPSNGKLLSVSPHMHYRGKSFEASVVAADKSTEPLIKVPNYDFNWQHRYEFKNPISLGDIRRLKGKVEFDNSKNNPFNPDPTQLVSWGDQTWEEMAIAFFDIEVPRKDVPEAARNRSVEDSTDFVRSITDRAERIERRRAKQEKEIWARFDKNGDGEIVRDEIPRSVRVWGFNRFDANRDGKVTRDEVRMQVEQRVK